MRELGRTRIESAQVFLVEEARCVPFDALGDLRLAPKMMARTAAISALNG